MPTIFWQWVTGTWRIGTVCSTTGILWWTSAHFMRSSPEPLEWEHWLQDPRLPQNYQIVRTLEYKTWHHRTTSITLCRRPHLNNKQNKNTNPIISKQDYHLTQPCPSEEKHTNKQTLSTNLTLFKAYTNQWINRRRAETKRKKEFNLETWEKETSNTVS